jgi:cation-transporting ATPase 13A3/4/5
MFAVALWLWTGYTYYASAIFIVSVASVVLNFAETRNNYNQIHDMAAYECQVTTLRDGVAQEVCSSELVPGDVIIVPDHTRLPCDAVLMSGKVVMNESNLTGESNPVLKDAVHLSTTASYSIDDDRTHSLFEGTTPI